jgi:hypothetical protein
MLEERKADAYIAIPLDSCVHMEHSLALREPGGLNCAAMPDPPVQLIG